MPDGLNNELRFHDDSTERQTGEIACDASGASSAIPVAVVVVGYGIGENHEFEVHSVQELRQACLDGLIAERLAYPEKNHPLLLCLRIRGRNYGPTSPEMWPRDSHGCFLVPRFEAQPDPFLAFWAAIGRLSNHVQNINAMCGRVVDAVD